MDAVEEQAQEIIRLRAKVEELEKDIKWANEQIAFRVKEVVGLLAKVKLLKPQLDTLTAEFERLQQRNTEIQTSLSIATERIVQVEEERDEANDSFASNMLIMWNKVKEVFPHVENYEQFWGELATLQSHLTQAQADLQRVTAERDRLEKVLKGDALVEHINYTAGQPMELHLSHPIQASMIAGFADLLKQSEAENYLEIQMSDRDGHRYICTVQRAEKPTPHELRRKAESEHSSLQSHLTQAQERERTLREALEFSWKHGKEHLRPWPAWTEYGSPQREGFHCYGCDGEFISEWPRWIKPTDQTFPHSADCSYLKYKAALQATGPPSTSAASPC